MSALADLIDSQNEVIVRRWRDRVTSTLLSGSLRPPELIDSLPDFLTQLARSLRQDVRRGEPGDALAPRSDVASEHGSQRLHAGFDVASVVREYAILHDIIFELAEEQGEVGALREHRLLSRILLSGVGDAVGQFTVDRDEQLHAQAARHLGFLAHELRNPLASARLSVALLARRHLLGESRSARLLQRSLDRMGELIDRSLVDMRLRSTGSIELEHLPLRAFLEEIASDTYLGDEDDRRHTLALDLPFPESATIEADRRLLFSAVSNLLRNALKFTPEGGHVQLRAKLGDARVVIEVEDECGGLPEHTLEQLFDPFVQLGKDRSGFGLGLAITKQAAAAHGGNVRVHDLPGKGCIFILDLPERPPRT